MPRSSAVLKNKSVGYIWDNLKRLAYCNNNKTQNSERNIKMKRFLQTSRLVGILVIGYIAFIITGRTPAVAHLSMVSLFSYTEGRSNDLISKFISLVHNLFGTVLPEDVPSHLYGGKSRDDILEVLNRDGYYVCDGKLSSELCDALLSFATTQKSTPRASEQLLIDTEPVVYDRSNPKAVRYDFLTADLLANEHIQELISELSILSLAQGYLKSTPYLDVLGMWWHTDRLNTPDKEAAQYFHFDLDRPKWLKVFIYLTDVDENTGPHMFVKGSHATGAIPKKILDKGYARLTDREILANYDPSSIVTMTGERGTVILEDTRGLHKGAHIKKGDRLMLQFQLSNSLFGARYPKSELKMINSEQLKQTLKNFSAVYRSYL
jgi:hypothetical protein